jgi:hypothetical protein
VRRKRLFCGKQKKEIVMPYVTPPPKAVSFDKVDISEIDLGRRFIHRIDQFKCWYVQLRASVEGTRHYGPSKTFYDKDYGGKMKALEEAIKFRDKHVWNFFRKVNYDPTLLERRREHAQRERERPKKFKIRKEAKTGPLSNIRYIRLLKRKGKYVRCVLEVTVNVHGKRFTSTAYSYSFVKYGGMNETLKIAKKDRDRLAVVVHKKAEMLNQKPPMSKKETRDEIKSIKFELTPPRFEFDPDKYIRRSSDNTFWIVELRKQVNHFDFRPPNMRFNDADFDGKKHMSRIAARKYVINVMTALNREADKIKALDISDPQEIQDIFNIVLETFAG